MSTRLLPLPDFQYQQSRDQEDLEPGVFIKALHCRISAVVSIAGGTTDGTLLSEGVQRLLRQFRMVWDGTNIIDDLSGRDLFQLGLMVGAQAPTESQLSAPGTGVSSETIEVSFVIPFAREYLVNPWNTVFPPVPINSQLRVYVDWETSAAGTGTSDAGTGALITGGDRNVTFDAGGEPTLEIVQEVAADGAAPWFLPVYSTAETRTWSSAESRLVYQLVSDRRFDSFIFRTVQGANAEPQDALNNLSMISGSVRHLDDVTRERLTRIYRDRLPAVGAETGYTGIIMANGGKLGNLFDPNDWPATRFELDLDAPTGSPGAGRFIMSELLSVEGITKF